MTQDEIIKMAMNSGASKDGRLWLMYSEDLEAFAKLVEDAAFKRWVAQTKLAVQDEREACAELCMSLHTLSDGAHNYYHFAANQIRERGEA